MAEEPTNMLALLTTLRKENRDKDEQIRTLIESGTKWYVEATEMKVELANAEGTISELQDQCDHLAGRIMEGGTNGGS